MTNNQERQVTSHEGPLAVEFTRHPRQGRKVGKVSVIMLEDEIPNRDIEATRLEFQANWKATVRKYNLEIM